METSNLFFSFFLMDFFNFIYYYLWRIFYYYRHFVEGDFLYIVIEFIENGDMENYIETHKRIGQHIPEEQLWSIFLQCMEGLAFVHEKGVIHRDIKPANLLVDNNMNVKLGDFGVSAVKINNNDEGNQYLNGIYDFSTKKLRQVLDETDEDLYYIRKRNNCITKRDNQSDIDFGKDDILFRTRKSKKNDNLYETINPVRKNLKKNNSSKIINYMNNKYKKMNNNNNINRMKDNKFNKFKSANIKFIISSK